MNIANTFSALANAAYLQATTHKPAAAEQGKAPVHASQEQADAVNNHDTIERQHQWRTGDNSATWPKRS
jgi:hypothetical protein